jgi:hypothetical protein
MWFVYTLLVIGSIASIVNLGLLFALALFVVRSRARQDEFNSDLVMMISGFEPPEEPVVQPQMMRPKTWDEKYEEELASVEQRMRGDAGLTDLPEPKATFGEPPAANTEAREGLTFRDAEGNMR